MILFDMFRGSKESQRFAGRTRALLATGLVSALLLVPGCSDSGKSNNGGESASSPASTTAKSAPESEQSGTTSNLEKVAQEAEKLPEVNVYEATTENIRYTHEWPASTKSAHTVDVHARIEGTIENFSFREGYKVTEGQVLFTIDDAPYRAAAQSAQADLSKAKADLQYAKSQVNVRAAEAKVASAKVSLNRAQLDVDRYKPLAANGTIATQVYDNAVASRDVADANLRAAQAELANTRLSDKANIDIAAAQVEAAQARLTQANLNIGYCTITSPVTGVVGKLNVYPGNLVGKAGSNTPLVTLSKLDPIYVNFSLSEEEYLYVMSHSDEPNEGVDFELVLSDGSIYPFKGTFGMLDRTMDAATGSMGVRISFPNPNHVLREGQYGKLRITAHKETPQVVIPQRAVMNTQNEKSVYVLNDKNVVQSRVVQLGNTHGDNYIVTNGLKAGDKIVVDGMSTVKPGSPCQPIMVTE